LADLVDLYDTVPVGRAEVYPKGPYFLGKLRVTIVRISKEIEADGRSIFNYQEANLRIVLVEFSQNSLIFETYTRYPCKASNPR